MWICNEQNVFSLHNALFIHLSEAIRTTISADISVEFPEIPLTHFDRISLIISIICFKVKCTDAYVYICICDQKRRMALRFKWLCLVLI